MIVLTSDGLSTKSLRDSIKRQIPRKGKAAIITTASAEYKEKDKHIPSHILALCELGYSISCMDVEHEDPKRLKDFDLILINGGNPYYLLHHLRKSGADKVLKEMSEAGRTLIGVSAGSVVLQERFDLMDCYTAEMNAGVHVDSKIGVGLTNSIVMPHYDRCQQLYPAFESKLYDFEQKNQVKVTRLKDGEAVIINDDGSIDRIFGRDV